MRITTCLALLLCFSASYAAAQEPSPVDVTTETQSDEQWRSHIDRARTAYEAADGAAMDSAVQTALGIAQSDFADDDSRLALTHIYIGIAQLLNGRHAEAEPPLRLALSIYDETGGRERLEAVAAISALAEARIAQGDMTKRGVCTGCNYHGCGSAAYDVGAHEGDVVEVKYKRCFAVDRHREFLDGQRFAGQ